MLPKEIQTEVEKGTMLPLMEEFYTIQGEGYHTGTAAYFIRIGGCDVGCHWCDVKESWNAAIHPPTNIDHIVENASKYANGKKWAWIGISEPKGTPNIKIIFLNTNEYAKELFRVLREIETTKVEVIIAEKPEQKGIGLALTDRLIKAAGN